MPFTQDVCGVQRRGITYFFFLTHRFIVVNDRCKSRRRRSDKAAVVHDKCAMQPTMGRGDILLAIAHDNRRGDNLPTCTRHTLIAQMVGWPHRRN